MVEQPVRWMGLADRKKDALIAFVARVVLDVVATRLAHHWPVGLAGSGFHHVTRAAAHWCQSASKPPYLAGHLAREGWEPKDFARPSTVVAPAYQSDRSQPAAVD